MHEVLSLGRIREAKVLTSILLDFRFSIRPRSEFEVNNEAVQVLESFLIFNSSPQRRAHSTQDRTQDVAQ